MIGPEADTPSAPAGGDDVSPALQAQIETRTAQEAMKELMARIAPLRLPVICVIGLPNSKGFASATGGMKHPQNRKAMGEAVAKVVEQLARQEGKPK